MNKSVKRLTANGLTTYYSPLSAYLGISQGKADNLVTVAEMAADDAWKAITRLLDEKKSCLAALIGNREAKALMSLIDSELSERLSKEAFVTTDKTTTNLKRGRGRKPNKVDDIIKNDLDAMGVDSGKEQ